MLISSTRRTVAQTTAKLVPFTGVRFKSSSSSSLPPVTVTKHALFPDKKEPVIAVVSLARPPANAANAELISSLLHHLKTLEADKSVRGFVLASEVKGIYSAGIDLDVFNGGEKTWRSYWNETRAVYRAIYSSRLESVAAITGHAPGLGCALALACRDRFMLRSTAGGGRIGLNEVAVGLPMPAWLTDRYVEVIGYRNAERLLPLGSMLPADEAARVGLIDRVFEDSVELMDAAKQHLSTLCGGPATSKNLPPPMSDGVRFARHETFKTLRERHLRLFDEGEKVDVETMWRNVNSEPVQATINALKSKLKSKKL
ncbi:ClpP/crotonase [Ramicandelaber brevisporus]|nr:ClpP/crotonase [Ramicandelaber brevisporus]